MNKEVTNIKNVNILIKTISDEIEKGKIKLKNALEIEKTFSYWNIGMHINNHLLSNSDKSDYGEDLFNKISNTLNIGVRTLYLSVQFYKAYNNIKSLSNNLTWSHFKILLTHCLISLNIICSYRTCGSY